jgi:hypothetical protein
LDAVAFNVAKQNAARALVDLFNPP